MHTEKGRVVPSKPSCDFTEAKPQTCWFDFEARVAAKQPKSKKHSDKRCGSQPQHKPSPRTKTGGDSAEAHRQTLEKDTTYPRGDEKDGTANNSTKEISCQTLGRSKLTRQTS